MISLLFPPHLTCPCSSLRLLRIVSTCFRSQLLVCLQVLFFFLSQIDCKCTADAHYFIEQTDNTNYQYTNIRQLLLQRNELRRVSSTDTRTVVLHRSVGNRELSEVVTNHLSLDFNIVEALAIVNTDNRTNHLRNNQHVTEVSLHGLRTLILRAFSLLQINTTT